MVDNIFLMINELGAGQKLTIRSPQSLFVRQRRTLLFTVFLSLILRLIWVLLLDPQPSLVGGDGPFYMHLGDQIARGLGLTYGEPVAVVGPVYPVYLGMLQIVFGFDNVLVAARLGQALMGVGLSLLVFDLGRRCISPEVGIVAAVLVSMDLRFIVESGSISTESLLTMLLMLSIWLYFFAIEKDNINMWILVGISTGITTLTRGVAQFLPLIFLLHLYLLKKELRIWRSWVCLFSGFAIVVTPWMVRNWILFGSPKIAHGGAAHFWMGAQGDGRSLRKLEMMDKVNDLRIGDGGADRYSYISSAIDIIALDPIGFLRLRINRLGDAYLQPFGTVAVGVVFGNESIKDMVSSDSENSLLNIIRLPAFFPKLWIYMMHYGSIVAALLYMVMQRRDFRQWSVFVIVILYFSGVYAILTIIPRYLFPIMPLYSIMGAYVVVHIGYSSARYLRPWFVGKSSPTEMPKL